ncbi:hypothetical protein GF336_05660 [Candidatus Woesearchaeota archaeon]|nr:hypothetical protein [Candidatus Woesearchaeota archaeon]
MYKLLSFIPVETEQEETFDDLTEAQEVKEHCEALQPENIYIIKDEDNNSIE